MARYKNSKNKKDKFVIKKEMNELKKYWGDIPLQYITHDFYDKKCSLSIDEMKEYIPGYFFYHVIYPKYDDIKKTSALVEDKIKAYFLFSELGYRIVKPLFVTEEGCFDPVDSEFLDDNNLLTWLSKSASSKLFIKPVGGRGGKGIIIARRVNDNYYVDGKAVNLDFLSTLKGRYIVEPGIKQSSYVSSVYSNSVNTLRVITKRSKKSGEIHIIAITLRMGCSGREVDNSSQGGLLMGIDIDTGHSTNGYAVYEYGSERFYQHPDTGYNFSGFNVRNWTEFKRELMSIAKNMKAINLAGWDIAITDDGPLVIETNVQFGLDHTQSGVGGLKKHFIDGTPLELLN